MFCGRFSQGGDFRDTGMEGMHRFLKRVWRLVTGSSKFEVRSSKLSSKTAYIMHKTIKKVTEDIENLRYNTAISAIMEWVNFLEGSSAGPVSSFPPASAQSSQQSKPSQSSVPFDLRAVKEASFGRVTTATRQTGITRDEVENLLLLLAPFAPHMTEELWSRLQTTGYRLQPKKAVDSGQWTESIHTHPWPSYDSKLATSSKVELVVEVNGKVRDKIVVDRGINKEDVQALVLGQKNTQ